jgi:DedD protein
MDKKLKQRLLGAAVLVALAVIIVPELVKEPGNPEIDRSENAGSAEEIMAAESAPLTNYETLSAPLTESQPPPPSALPLPPMEETLEESESPRSGIGTDVARVPERETESEQAALPKPSPAEVEPWVVTEVVPEPEPDPPPEWQPVPQPRAESKPSGQPRPEPPPKSESAPKTKKPAIELPPLTLISKAGTQVPSPQASSPPKPATSPGGQRWMVQAGSFSQHQNADNFKDRLQSRGFNATVESARVNERILYRVRVGPQGSRTESQEVKARLAREIGVQGSIVLLRK